MEQSPAMRADYLVSGIRTPPVRRNSKLATLGRIFKPWKWRKKKNEKLKQTSAVLEKKMTARQGRDELIKKGLLEMMEQDTEGKACTGDDAMKATQSDPPAPVRQALSSEEVQQESTAATTNVTSLGEELHLDELKEDAAKKPSAPTEELEDASLPASEDSPEALLASESTDSPQKQTERNPAQLPSPPLLPAPPPKAISKITKSVTAGSEIDDPAMKSPPSTILKNYVIVGSSQISGQAALFHSSGQKSSDPHVRGQVTTPTGSPHLAAVHLPLPPSRVIEELHRALATKHRQDSFHGRESKGSPKKRVDVRPSRTSSIERNKEKENSLSHNSDSENKRNSVKESDENKENMIMNSELKEDSVFYQDEEVLNDSVISGTLPRKCKKELLAVKLRNRPSKQELEDRNIFPRRTDEERQEIRQQIEMKLSKEKQLQQHCPHMGAERISEGDVAQEHTYSERSPDLQESILEEREMLNFEEGNSPNNFCPQKKNNQSMCLNQSPETTVKKLTFGKKSFSPLLTEASLLSLTTYKTVSGKRAKGSVSETCDNNEDSSFRHCFSDTLSIKGKLQDITKPITKSKEEDCVPPSPLSVSSGSKVQSWSEEPYRPIQPYRPIHESGPTIQTFLKRRYHSDTESNSDEVEASKEEEKKGNRRTKLQPRRLFKTDDAVTYRVSESISTVSVKDLSVLDGEIWEPGCSTISICQKLQKEFTKKIESRSQKMDHFTKQSLRAAHEHLTTMNYQLHECRVRQLDKFHFALLEELENFEKDSQSLKNMEKEFSTFWKKHTHTFSTYMKNEQQRIQILKTSFEKNIYHTVDYEEHIFTSEMHLMKEDIKGLQEKLLKEMQEEELCNVRRGLETLFQSEDRILK